MNGFCPFLSKSKTDTVACSEKCNLCRYTVEFDGGVPVEKYECALELIANALTENKDTNN